MPRSPGFGCNFRKKNMFGILESLVKAAAVVVTAPVALAADIVTMGGAMTEKDEPYTDTAIKDFVTNIENIAKPK